ncbi:MAG: hypothetical protein EB078_00910 [Proteobacteria bacterium]|nr:hypothetical protein [Pseudomonadota bacterium]NDC22961.1 hypothetical protein [Pseudomonadota bacterium]NDD03438.1 hypothetical protein [Pseudomonadota bacterium]NDG27248.1 hypothetical protein [Pseudomonadota bacterium]
MRSVALSIFIGIAFLVPSIIARAAALTEISVQTAESQYHQHQFKASLATWTELLRKSPKNLHYALKVSELKLLIEGRSPAISFLKDYMKRMEKVLSLAQRKELQTKMIEWSEAFFSEEAQANYLQGLSKAKLREFSASLPALTQAALLEPGNLKILSLKAEIEKELGLNEASYQTLKEAFAIDPYSQRLREKLAESHIFHKHCPEVKILLEKESSFSPREKMAMAYCHLEAGDQEKAKELVEDLLQSRKSEWFAHPVTRWMAARLDLMPEPKKLFHPDIASKAYWVDGWDPYRIQTQPESLKH